LYIASAQLVQSGVWCSQTGRPYWWNHPSL